MWSPEQVRAIIEAVPSSFRALFSCVALTGLRLGELLGLQWKHVDLKNHKLQIEQSLWHGQIVPPKTAGSKAPVWFSEFLALALAEHCQNSKHTGPADFVFSKSDGSSLNADVLRKDVLYPTLDRLQIPRVSGTAGFHAFRHSAGSIVNEQTGNIKLVQRLLRHTNMSTTADVYTHTSEESERGAALALERAIFGDLFPVVPNLGNGNKNAAIN